MAESIEAQYAAAFQAYLDNADYDNPASASKCRAYITACRRLIAFPDSVMSLHERQDDQRSKFEKAMKSAQEWLNANPSAGSSSSASSSFVLIDTSSPRD